MKTPGIVRAAITAGWLAGVTAILAGVPVAAALAAPALSLAAALAGLRWGAGLRTPAAAALAGRLRRPGKTGGTLERA